MDGGVIHGYHIPRKRYQCDQYEWHYKYEDITDHKLFPVYLYTQSYKAADKEDKH